MMALSEDEVNELKGQLKEQVKDMSDDKKIEAEAQIDSMSNEAIEAMLNQQRGQQQQIFRMIVRKEVDSVIVDENSEAIGVLEINPLSKGHTLVIPKEVVTEKNKMPESILEFAKRIGGKIMKNLKPKKADVKIEEKFGEVIYEIVPEYDTPIGERLKVDKKELESVNQIINTEVIQRSKDVEVVKEEEATPEKVIRLPRRIP